MSRIEPDPCIPITDGRDGFPTNLNHHKMFSGEVAHTVVGAQCVFWCRGLRVGRYVWPLPELRPDGMRILKGFG